MTGGWSPRGRRARRRRLVAGCLSAVLSLALVAVPPAGPAQADPAPASTAERAADLAGGWLARQVTAGGTVIGAGADGDLRAAAWTTLALLGTGWGQPAVLRASERMVAEATRRTPAGLSVSELALLVLVFAGVGGDAGDVGPAGLDLIAELRSRRQTAGVDAGLHGPSSPLETPVQAHALALLALASAGEEVPAAATSWLAGQQCPDGGWPTYRDAASRSSGTCEIIPSSMFPTSLAAMAAVAVGLAPARPVEPFLRAAATPSGAFAAAPGLSARPVATALGVMAIRALTGAAPDGSWAGEVGTPQDILRLEQLGCAWHGADRGAVPGDVRDTGPQDGSGEPTPVAGTPVPPPGGSRDANADAAAGTEGGGADAGPAQASGDQAQAPSDQAQAPSDQAQASGDQAQASGDQAQAPSDQAQASGDQAQAPSDQAQVSGPAPRGAAAPPIEVALAALALTGEVLPLRADSPALGDPFPGCPVTRSRLAGPSRVLTAVAVSADAFPDGAPAAVVATTSTYADALAASAVAGRLGGPVLLSTPSSAPDALLAEVSRLGATEVVLVGGTAALSPQVASDLAALERVTTVRRLAGPTRYDTAAAAAREVGGTRAFVVRGSGPAAAAPWADAVSVGAWAASRGVPVLLSDLDRLPPATARALADRREAIIIGGPAAVSEAVATEVAGIVPRTRRVAGPSRVATSAAVFRAAFADGADAVEVFLATTTDFPDALVAGPAAAARDGMVLLVDPSRGLQEQVLRLALLDVDFIVDRVVLTGGPTGLPDAIAEAVAVLVREGVDG